MYRSCNDQGKIKTLIDTLDSEITDEEIKNIESNYQSEIRIGCFTDSPNNLKMWNKYSDCGKGYCIEYDTSKHDLFKLSTFRVQYSPFEYDLSLSYVSLIILESDKRGKQKSDEEMIETYHSIYEKILKMIYVPLFIKKPCWEFEHEFRMILLKHRMTRQGMIKMDDFLDKNSNVNLSNAITSIYLVLGKA